MAISNNAVTAVRLLRADLPGTVMGAPEEWPRWQVLFAHVTAATGHIGSFVEASVETGGDGGVAEAVSWLLDRAGIYEQVHARLASARALLERAVRIDEAVYGPDNPEVTIDLCSLAGVLQDPRDSGAAQPVAGRPRGIPEAVNGPDHLTGATHLINLAMVLQDLGDPGDARPLFERASDVIEAVYGPDHPTVAALRSRLAGVLQDLGEPPTYA